MRFADLDAVTVDGYGTLVTLVDPVPSLSAALREHAIAREPHEVAAAFSAEVAHYRPRAHLGRDADSLARLRLECAGVFLEALGDPIPPESFVDAFIDALQFVPVLGAAETLRLLASRRLALAVCANWDCALPQHLARLGLDGFFRTVVTSAEAGTPKPNPAVFRLALERLGVEPDRALHVGDEEIDEQGAVAAGMAFRPAPLRSAFAGFA